MSNYKTLKKEVLTYLKARIPLIVIQTTERIRIERMLTEISVENKIDMNFYSDSKQVYKPTSLSSTDDASGDPIQYALNCFKKKKGLKKVEITENNVRYQILKKFNAFLEKEIRTNSNLSKNSKNNIQ